MEQVPKLELSRVRNALHTLGRRGGAERIARVTGRRLGVILNELNPTNASHKVGLIDSLYYQAILNDYHPFEACATALGFSLTRLANLSGISDVELLTTYADWVADLADVHRTVAVSLADQRVTHREYQRVYTEFHDSVGKGIEFLRRLKSVVEDEVPTPT